MEVLTGGYKEQEILRYHLDYFFPVVDVRNLKLNDEIFRHEPKTEKQAIFRSNLIDAIRMELPNFRAQAMDQSINSENMVVYGRGLVTRIETDKSFTYHGIEDSFNTANKGFHPDEMRGALGTIYQRRLFLGVLMKEMISLYHISVERAWELICDNSKKIANSGTNHYESTGSRPVGRWYDLGNIPKYVTRGYETTSHFKEYGEVKISLCYMVGSSAKEENAIADEKELTDYYSVTYLRRIKPREDILHSFTPWMVLNVEEPNDVCELLEEMKGG